MTLKNIRNLLEQKKGTRDRIMYEIDYLEDQILSNKSKLKSNEEAREIIRAVGLKTQQQLQYHISDITSMALETVYQEPYTLIVEFVQRRNKTECDLYFKRNGNRYTPMDDAGGGVINIAAFALRVASWNLQTPRSRNTIILDEPFGNVSTDLLPRVGEMLKQISEKLQLQIIMVTHANDLIDIADKSFTVYNHKGISHVKRRLT
jgi:DNA repair exonuclease SbcCD ATPase subunit